MDGHTGEYTPDNRLGDYATAGVLDAIRSANFSSRGTPYMMLERSITNAGVAIRP